MTDTLNIIYKFFDKKENSFEAVIKSFGDTTFLEIPPYHNKLPVVSIRKVQLENGEIKDCLDTVVLPDTLEIIDSGCFKYSSVKKVVIGKNLHTIKESAFFGCFQLSSINLPQHLRTIERNAFQLCRELSYLNFPDSVSFIGDGAFAYSGLVNINLPIGLTIIPKGTFHECSLLKTVVVPKNIESIEIGAFRDCILLDQVILPETLDYIANSAFYGCKNLSKIEFPTSTTYIGDEAFYGCNLIEVVLPAKLQKVNEGCFSRNYNLQKITLNSGLTEIEGGAFYMNNLDNITIPKSCLKISSQAFTSKNPFMIKIQQPNVEIHNQLTNFKEAFKESKSSLNLDEQHLTVFCEGFYTDEFLHYSVNRETLSCPPLGKVRLTGDSPSFSFQSIENNLSSILD